MVGARSTDQAFYYPVEELARARGAGVAVETTDPKVAYANAGPRESIAAPPPFAAGGTA